MVEDPDKCNSDIDSKQLINIPAKFDPSSRTWYIDNADDVTKLIQVCQDVLKQRQLNSQDRSPQEQELWNLIQKYTNHSLSGINKNDSKTEQDDN